MQALFDRLPALSVELNKAQTHAQLAEVIRADLHQALGLTNAWLYTHEPDAMYLTITGIAGSKAEFVLENYPQVPIEGDPFIEAVLSSQNAIIIPDALAITAVNQEIVADLRNRTLIAVSLVMVDSYVGFLGAGTFGDEGPVEMPEGAQTYLGMVAAVLSAAMSRIHLLKERQQREEIQAKLLHYQSIESLGQLAGGVAHDLNNLLTVIQSSIYYLQRSGIDKAYHDELEVIIDAIESAGGLTRQLLALGRQQGLESVDVDLLELVENTSRFLERVLPPNIKITNHHESPLIVRGDRNALEQIVMNLAINARDAMHNGGQLTIKTEATHIDEVDVPEFPWVKSGQYALIAVSDTGVGISEDTQARMFDPFFTTKGEEGTGLGLAVVYGTVKQHLGMLRCHSELDRGTTLEILLPLQKRRSISALSKPKKTALGKGERVLVIDDQKAVRQFFGRVLKNANYDVTTVSSGALALEAFREAPFALVILDVVMPDMDGRATYEAINAMGIHTRFIFVSGYGASVLPLSMFRDIQVSMLSKPTSPDTLLRTVRNVLDDQD